MTAKTPMRTLAGGRKMACRECGRTVSVCKLSDGSQVMVDPELIAVVEYDASPQVTLKARRLHGEVCLQYRLQREREDARRRLRGE